MVSTKKLVSWLAIAFVIFYVIQSPHQSADIIRSIGSGLSSAANQIAEFVRSL
ncbi:MAG TPA: hypothetical protein VGH85_10310 [Mycobacteriales bacterium]